MNHRARTLPPALIFALAAVGCAEPAAEEPAKPASTPASRPAPEPAAAGKRIPYPNVDSKVLFLEVMPDKTRRVLVESEVCMREGTIELLLCKAHTKEHEAILRSDVDARHLKAVLIAADMKEGSPVQFEPDFKPARGDRVRISLRYAGKDGKPVEVSAREWVRHQQTKKPLDTDWVFAGSKLFFDPEDKTRPAFFAANAGDLITVVNFDTALLDVPVQSSKNDAERSFEANTDLIPPKETKVTVVLEKAPDAKPDEKK